MDKIPKDKIPKDKVQFSVPYLSAESTSLDDFLNAEIRSKVLVIKKRAASLASRFG